MENAESGCLFFNTKNVLRFALFDECDREWKDTGCVYGVSEYVFVDGQGHERYRHGGGYVVPSYVHGYRNTFVDCKGVRRYRDTMAPVPANAKDALELVFTSVESEEDPGSPSYEQW